MEKIEKILEVFLAELRQSVNPNVEFKIDFSKNKIIITNCPSGFVKQIVNVNGACTHLTKEGLTFELFKR